MVAFDPPHLTGGVAAVSAYFGSRVQGFGWSGAHRQAVVEEEFLARNTGGFGVVLGVWWVLLRRDVAVYQSAGLGLWRVRALLVLLVGWVVLVPVSQGVAAGVLLMQGDFVAQVVVAVVVATVGSWIGVIKE